MTVKAPYFYVNIKYLDLMTIRDRSTLTINLQINTFSLNEIQIHKAINNEIKLDLVYNSIVNKEYEVNYE